MHRLAITMNSSLNREVKRLVSHGHHYAALELYRLQIHPSQLVASTSILPSIIRACASARSHNPLGSQLHGIALKSGSQSDSVVSNSIISMYSKFSMPGSAQQVFDEMPHRDPISWNSLINGYLQNGCLVESLEALREMYLQGFFPRLELVAGLVSVCGHLGKLRLGKQIHARVLFNVRSEGSVLLSTALLHMYLTCHDLWTGFQVFDRMPAKNEISWTALILGCIANNKHEMAMSCLWKMQDLGLKPNRVTMIGLLQACAGLGYLKHGKEIHGYALHCGFDSEDRFSAALLHMYCECKEQLTCSRAVFESCGSKDVVAWSSIIRSYALAGEAASAMELFSQMRIEGIRPNSVTLLAVMSACTALSSLTLGWSVHGHLIKSGLNMQVLVENSLINMYAKCGCLLASRQIFSEMAEPDLVSWSTLIAAYGLHGHGEEALELFREMKRRDIQPDEVTLLSVLSGCNHGGLAEEGQKLFKDAVIENKIPLSSEHYSCFIDLLGRSGQLEEACEVIRTMPMKPSLKVRTSLAHACKARGRLDIAGKLVNQLTKAEPKSAANHTLFSMVLAELRDWSGVEEVRRLMIGQKLEKCSGISRIELHNASII